MSSLSEEKEEKFVHLHLHTQYSSLDGAIKIHDLMPRLKELGMQSCAITDHGVMYGVIDFYKACKKNNIKPIIGCEFYVAPGKLTDRDYKKGDLTNYHLVLLAENDEGLHNLYKMSTMAFLDGFYRKPRIDKDILRKHSKGVIALSACLAGEVARKLWKDTRNGGFSTNTDIDYNAALNAAKEYEEIMGKGNFFLEIQENGLPAQIILNKQLVNISNETGIPLVATCDCHYMKKEDHTFHHILMQMQRRHVSNKNNDEVNGTAINTNIEPENISETSQDNNNFMQECSSEDDITDNNKEKKYSIDQLYVKCPEEMISQFKYAPSAVENTVKIANRCNVNIQFKEGSRLPTFQAPDNYTLNEYFKYQAETGLKKRLEKIPQDLHDTYYKRLKEEIEIITLKGFDGYYLVVQDFINYSRQNGIPVGPGRGSGAGSLVAYALTITDIDPIKYNLLFERFLNPERVSMPDFDIDFCTDRRDEVIEYVKQKYGAERTSQIVTFGSIKPRNAIRGVARVIDVPLSEVDQIVKVIPKDPGIDTFEKVFASDPTAIKEFEKSPKRLELLDYAKKIIGLISQISTHAGGVIIADKPIIDYSPLCISPRDQAVITQFDKKAVETIGFVKFDFLGLKNLTIIDKAIKDIHATVDSKFDIKEIPLDDKAVFEMLQKGDTTGVFQLESSGMRNLLRHLRPTVFEDIIAVNALFRPGPIKSGMLGDFVDRKHGKQEIKYDFPELEPILNETYGIIVYQEQVMQIACKLAGYTLGSADILRRAMGKKDKDEMARQKAIFLNGNDTIKGAINLGYDAKKATALFDLIAKFAEYGFNKSHSTAYALVAYQTAYLKVHYPLQYMSALITGFMNRAEDAVNYILEVKRMGIEILAPDINKSYCDFRAEGKSIRFGLGMVKNIGSALIESFIAEREKRGAFKDIFDFARRVDYKSLNTRAVESIVTAGAFDFSGKNRGTIFASVKPSLQSGSVVAKSKAKFGQTIDDFLFADDDDNDSNNETIAIDNEANYPKNAEWTKKETLENEKLILGFYYSDHPLSSLKGTLGNVSMQINHIKTMDGGEAVATMGMIKKIRPHFTPKQEKMAFLTIEDLTGEIDIVIFPKVYREVAPLLLEDNIIVIKGKTSSFTKGDDEIISIQADEIKDFGTGMNYFVSALTLSFQIDDWSNDTIEELKDVLLAHHGSTPLRVVLTQKDKYSVTFKLPETYYISLSLELISKLHNIIGFEEITPVALGTAIYIPADVYEQEADDMANNNEEFVA